MMLWMQASYAQGQSRKLPALELIEWSQPSDAGYWELTGLNEGGGIEVQAFAGVNTAPEPDGRVAFLATYSLSLDENFAVAVRRSVGDTFELRYVGRDEAGISMQVREAPGFGFTRAEQWLDGKTDPNVRNGSLCLDGALRDFSHLGQGRLAATQRCARFLQWSEWRPLRFPLRYDYVLGKKMRLSLDGSGEALRVKVYADPAAQ